MKEETKIKLPKMDSYTDDWTQLVYVLGKYYKSPLTIYFMDGSKIVLNY